MGAFSDQPLRVGKTEGLAAARFSPVVVLDAHIVLGRVLQIRHLLLGESSNPCCRPAYIQVATFKDFSRRHKAACADHDVIFDDDVVHDDRAHPNKAFISDRASMKDRRVPYGDVVSDEERGTVRLRRASMGHMSHCEVLDVGAIANDDVIDVPPQHRIAPNGAIATEFYVAYHVG